MTRGIEGVVDIEDVAMARAYMRGELVDEGGRQTRCIRSRRRVLEPGDGRLRGERRARLRASADRHLQGRVVAQPVVIDAVLIAAADAEHARADDLAQRMANARGIAPVGQRRGEPGDDADLLLGRPQRQQAAVRGLVAAIEIDCEFLGTDGWQIEGKRRSVVHGCRVPLRRRHARLATVCYADSTAYATATAQFLKPDA